MKLSFGTARKIGMGQLQDVQNAFPCLLVSRTESDGHRDCTDILDVVSVPKGRVGSSLSRRAGATGTRGLLARGKTID